MQKHRPNNAVEKLLEKINGRELRQLREENADTIVFYI